MENLTRRRFIQGATAIAAGAAVGLTAYKGFREYGPVDLWLYLFSKDPITVKAALFSDERKDIFGLRVLDEHGDAVRAELPLSRIKAIVAAGSPEMCPAIVHCRGARAERMPVTVAVESSKFTLRSWEECPPAWLRLQDVRHVL